MRGWGSVSGNILHVSTILSIIPSLSPLPSFLPSFLLRGGAESWKSGIVGETEKTYLHIAVYVGKLSFRIGLGLCWKRNEETKAVV